MPRRPTPMMSPLERRLLLARTIYVDASATGTNDGTSWPTAYTDLQSALAIATSGDTIDVAQGTYKPTTSTDPTTEIQSSFNLVEGVTLLGGFAGNAGANPNSRDTTTFPTILSGNVGDTSQQSGSSCHVVIAQGVGTDTVLDGVTIESGCTLPGGVGGLFGNLGAGILVTDASPLIRNCVVRDNTGVDLSLGEDSGGGLAAIGDSEPTIVDCSFIGNTASYGGALSLASSMPVNVESCTFIGNCSKSNSQNFGGGAIFADANASVANCSFLDNSSFYGGAIFGSNWFGGTSECSFSRNSSGYGGAVYLASGCDISVSTCNFSENLATSLTGIDLDVALGEGGAIYCDGGTLTVDNSVFSSNTAITGGGCFAINSTSIAYESCDFESNVAQFGDGGAILNSDAVIAIDTCTFRHNTASSGSSSPYDSPFTNPGGGGGGVYDDSCTLTEVGCHFDENAAACGAGQTETNGYSTIVSTDFIANVATAYGLHSGPAPHISLGGQGGAIGGGDAFLTISNCTIADNRVSAPSGQRNIAAGGGIYTRNSTFALDNSIVYGNIAPRESGIAAPDSTNSYSNNDISGGTGGPPASNFNPRFARDPSPGADGKWGTADDDLGDLHLQYNSPALGKGNPALLPDTDTTDASGNPRLRNGQLDLGAYETGPADFAVSTLSLKPLRSPATPTNLSLSGTLSVLNDGSSVPSGKLTVELFLSSTTNVPTGTPAASPIATLLVSTAHLTPGTPFRLPFSLRLKGKTAAGTYYVVAEANPNNALPEATETNNTTASPALTL